MPNHLPGSNDRFTVETMEPLVVLSASVLCDAAEILNIVECKSGEVADYGNKAVEHCDSETGKYSAHGGKCDGGHQVVAPKSQCSKPIHTGPDDTYAYVNAGKDSAKVFDQHRCGSPAKDIVKVTHGGGCGGKGIVDVFDVRVNEKFIDFEGEKHVQLLGKPADFSSLLKPIHQRDAEPCSQLVYSPVINIYGDNNVVNIDFGTHDDDLSHPRGHNHHLIADVSHLVDHAVGDTLVTVEPIDPSAGTIATSSVAIVEEVDAVGNDTVETTEDIALFNDDFRTIDGKGNSLEDTERGAVGSQLIRLADPDYSDGVGSLAGQDRPGPREISNAVHAQSESILNEKGHSSFLWAWGQFIDHDLDLTKTGSGEFAPISVPMGDPHFDPTGTGTSQIALERSSSVTDEHGIRQHLNEITAFVDASQIYGSDAENEDYLRSHVGGQLLMPEQLLQIGTGEDGREGFDSGDIRAGENIVLTSLHTLFSREHNRIATALAESEYVCVDLNDTTIDEEIFQRARAIVGAQMQHITYEEFLPALLGEGALSEYKGYDANVDPGIATEFSTAAFRVGHTMISSEIHRLDPYGNVIPEGNVALRDAFFNMDKLVESGIAPILQGAAAHASEKIDPYVIDDLRNFLFGAPGSGGLDLASLNIQRGRDHGLSSYNETREALGLSEITCFEDISSDAEVVAKLKSIYHDVDDIDLWVGGLAEDHHSKSSVGETFHTIIVDQFERLRDGDRYWHDNALSQTDLAYVEGTKLSDIIRRNTTADTVQDNVFFVPEVGTHYV